jgi:hypothetical protein
MRVQHSINTICTCTGSQKAGQGKVNVVVKRFYEDRTAREPEITISKVKQAKHDIPETAVTITMKTRVMTMHVVLTS